MAPIALLSVSNKQGLVPLAEALHRKHGFQLISSGGTAKVLENAGLPVKRVADHTGASEILGGRVKTLHPLVHGGILAKKGDPSHDSDMEKEGISHIDLVVVNLYPFQETISNPNVQWEQAIENIDIGGPAMIRAAAKNHSRVTILTSPNQYENFLKCISKGVQQITDEMRLQYAMEAFEHTAEYDIAISKWMRSKASPKASPWLMALPLRQNLRYGENPHQEASWYSHLEQGWGSALQLQGKELSTNNLFDLEAALSTVQEFGYGKNKKKEVDLPAVVVVKHCNPCGVAVANHLANALTKALDADRTSAFGGIIALNSEVDADSALQIKSLFVECVVAPGFSSQAREILANKSNLRLLELSSESISKSYNYNFRSILGGVLVQDQDNQSVNIDDWRVTTKRTPTIEEKEDLIFAWKVVRHVRSNAIVVASSGQTLGIGAGQMNRVGSAKLALESASKQNNGGVLASDGFFPFDDTVRLASSYGVKAIIQPGGSIKDKNSIEACDELGLSMIFTGKRHFSH